MTDNRKKSIPGWLQEVWRRRAWLLVSAVVLFAMAVRLRLREMPLERDEGEYAYAGQLILQGVAPYKLVYNMKFPGTYAAYAVVMALFGRSSSGIHLGLMLVNAASILLVFLLGRKLLDAAAGGMAALSFALLSLSPAVLGLAAHANHFVMLAVVAGLVVLLRACETGRWIACAASGCLFGLALLMKQHGLVFGVFGLLYLVWCRTRPERRTGWKSFLKESASFASGFLLPILLTCLMLWGAGVFKQFLFWTFAYAREYVGAVSLADAHEIALRQIRIVAAPDFAFWVLAGIAAVMMWWEERLAGYRLLLIGFLLCSFVAWSLGLQFREHYFILLLPALSLFAGVAVSRAIYLVKHDKTIELFLAVAIFGLLPLGIVFAFAEHGNVWFGLSAAKASSTIYGSNLFPETLEAARYLAQRTSPDARIAVLGSEPEIYFYSGRRSATGYVYTYPLMEPQRYALRMQEEMIREIEQAQPGYVVYVKDNDSWLTRPNSQTRITDWWTAYWAAHYETDRTLPIEIEQRRPWARAQNPDDSPQEPKYLLVLKRKT
jgi:hypothetical protein